MSSISGETIKKVKLMNLLARHSKVSLLVVALWGDLWHVYSGRLGVIVADLCYVALFEDFSL